MNIYREKIIGKVLLVVTALLIGGLSLYYNNRLASDIAVEETKRMQLWAGATRQIALSDTDTDVSFYFNIIQNNNTIPVILVDEDGDIISAMNLPKHRESDSAYCVNHIDEMAMKHEPIRIDLPDNRKNYLYYDDSKILKRLAYYPIIQLSIIALFALVAYLIFSSSRRAEQNRVWVGMAKETAHQLGTPISSLMAWVELLRQSKVDSTYLDEMQKDVDRLQIIADRFSKVGSVPDLQQCDLEQAVANAVDYMRRRVSENVVIKIENEADSAVFVSLSGPLFNWVIENLIKNAIDAMNGRGTITITISETAKKAVLLVSDTGKGLYKNQFKTVFKPGYTTKERGWGLGLSLSQRIIQNYHKGRISVLSSEIDVGTTFRILLPKKTAR